MNLEGIRSGELTLDGATLAKIFLGEIGTWSDPAIARLNPNVTLPSLPIVVVHRGDDSGTTFVWTDYLSKVSREIVRIAIPASEIERLKGLKIVPGMPVEAFIQTSPRTVMSFLIKPLHDQISHAFRER